MHPFLRGLVLALALGGCAVGGSAKRPSPRDGTAGSANAPPPAPKSARPFLVTTDPILEQRERETIDAVAVLRGKKGYVPGWPLPLPVAKGLTELRAAKVPMHAEITTQPGGAQTLEVKSPNLTRWQELAKKIKEQTASPSEKKEHERLDKSFAQLRDVKYQLFTLSIARNGILSWQVQLEMKTLFDVKNYLMELRLRDLEVEDADVHVIAERLTVVRRAEALTASTLGLEAAYRAAINDGADPKAVDLLADAVAASIPIKVTVTDAEARGYIAGVAQSFAAKRAEYEVAMRSVFGEQYDRTMKASYDSSFDLSERTERAVDEYKRSTSARRAHADAVAVGAAGGANGRTGDGATPRDSSGGSAVDLARRAPAGRATLRDADRALRGAKALSSGDLTAALEVGAESAPDGPFKSALEGASAIAKGDPKRAFKAAIGLAAVALPGGSVLGQGLTSAAKLLGL